MKAETLQAAINHAVATYPQESCGLIVVVKGKERYFSCRNIANTKSEHFVLHPEDWAQAEDLGEIIGMVHSHPDAAALPSEADLVSCEASGVPWHILSIGRNEKTGVPEFAGDYAWKPNGYKAPLVGREFHHGVLDCYTLIRDYHEQEMGIIIPDFERADGWWDNGQNLYMEQFEKAGFVQVDPSEMRKGDGIIMQIRSPVPNHAGIYLGDGLFLHHLYGRLSSRDVYGGYWREVTSCVVRHKDSK